MWLYERRRSGCGGVQDYTPHDRLNIRWNHKYMIIHWVMRKISPLSWKMKRMNPYPWRGEIIQSQMHHDRTMQSCDWDMTAIRRPNKIILLETPNFISLSLIIIDGYNLFICTKKERFWWLCYCRGFRKMILIWRIHPNPSLQGEERVKQQLLGFVKKKEYEQLFSINPFHNKKRINGNNGYTPQQIIFWQHGKIWNICIVKEEEACDDRTGARILQTNND